MCNHGHNIPLCLKMTIPLLIYPHIRGLCKEISLLIKCIKDASRVLPEREVLAGILATPLRSVDAREQTHTSCHCARTEDRTRQGARQGGGEKLTNTNKQATPRALFLGRLLPQGHGCIPRLWGWTVLVGGRGTMT